MDTSNAIERNTITSEYRENCVRYILANNPKLSRQQVEEKVVAIMKSRFKNPKTEILEYPSYGNVENKSSTLLKMTKINNNKVLSPSGTFYETTDKNNPLLKAYSDTKTIKRNTSKKQMFVFMEQERMLEASLMNYKQQAEKVNNNSISGAYASVHNAMYDLESYNAITSLSRCATISTYAFTERFLCNNFIFTSYEELINFVVVNTRSMPSYEEIAKVVQKHNLTKPSYENVADMLTANLTDYVSVNTAKSWRDKLSRYLYRLDQNELTYLFYSQNLHNVFTFNSEYFKNYLNSMFDLDKSEEYLSKCNNIPEGITGSILKSIDEDLFQAMTIIYSYVLEGKSMNFIKDPINNRQDIIWKIHLLADLFGRKIAFLDDILNTLLHNRINTPNPYNSKNIKRRGVVVSDTDSVIFTVKQIVSWYVEQQDPDKEPTPLFPVVYKANPRTIIRVNDTNNTNVFAVITYFLCKCIVSLLAIYSYNRGCVGKDNIKKIKMKNEFFYPIFMRTDIGKHYVGKMTIQEGIFLSKPKLDIKGVHFKNSTVPKRTFKKNEELINSILNDVIEHGTIYAGDYINTVLEYESSILKDLKAGNLSYYQISSIKKKDEYKNPEASIYFNYNLWEEVFSEKYGHIHPPTRCPILPIIPGSINEEYLQWLSMKTPSIHEKLVKFLEDNKGKKISRIPISTESDKLPEELIPLVNTRDIIYKNAALLQLPLKSILVDLGDKKKKPLLMDYYDTQ